MSLTRNMFSPAISKTIGKKSSSMVRTRLSTPIIYYIPDGTMTRDQILDLAMACIVACTSKTAPLEQWKSLIATFTNLLFDGIVTKLPRDQYSASKVPMPVLQELRQAFVRLDKECDDLGDESVTGLGNGAFADYMIDWNLPKPDPDVPGGWGTYCRAEKQIYIHYALIVFLAGKQITAENRRPITIARPKALIDKYKIEATEILTGSLRISDHGHSMIFQAWLEMSSLKAECFREFSTYTESNTSLGQDIIMTNVNLMRFSQMNHAAIIRKFLLAYPWATELSYLRQSVALYMDSLNSAADIELHLQPFVKIIWGDKSGLFPRKDLGPLIAVALDTEKEINETLMSYYSDEKFASVVEAFRDERSRREAKTTQASKIVETPDNDTEYASDNESEAAVDADGDVAI